ncbi:DUF421 domain-containing protein [Streptomyces reniochalinae]|uniref:Uncharacterized protein n=1 Tax=Streptomyces reniochalinae TaxID=2250578 RepID=A0A367EZZ3_9ACTN|nr:hypothetical protein [Streptomyces reniochalinae]RCG23279.1 hypothetical protein DQ392_05020 [Streptomyces reniochalinae]
MWHAMMTIEIPVVEKILRTALVYAVIVVLFRISGKRGLASMNTFDFVVVPDPQAVQSTRADIDRIERRLAAIEELLRANGREQSDKG